MLFLILFSIVVFIIIAVAVSLQERNSVSSYESDSVSTYQAKQNTANISASIAARYTPYKQYKVKGKNPATNRMKTHIVVAKSTLTETEIGAKSELLDPYTVTIDSESYEMRPPSRKQLDYAKDLDISVPTNCTCMDLSCLISKKLGQDSDDFISYGLICFAGDNNLLLSPYSGIYSATCSILNGLEDEMVFMFFSYLIYCLKTNRIVDDPRSSPYKDIFSEFGATYANDDAFVDRFSFDDTHIFRLISKKSFDKRNKNNAYIYDTVYNFLSSRIPF